MIARIIEIIGAPGTGKSTIYQSLCNTWRPRSPWIYPDTLITPEPGIFSFPKWIVYRLRLALHKKLTRSIPVEFGLRFAGQNRNLARCCWDVLSDIRVYSDQEIHRRFRSAHFFFTTFCMYQAILEKASAKPCIIEEGFLQKSFFTRTEEVDQQLAYPLVDEYLSLVPLPFAVIHIDTYDVDEIVRRLRRRQKIIASHLDLGDDALRRDIKQWQRAQHYLLDRLKRQGVMIVPVNAKEPVRANVSAIDELLKKISVVQKAPGAAIKHPAESTINFGS